MQSHCLRLPGPFQLQSGHELPRVEIAYQTYGHLSEARDNAILILHGLTHDQHAAGPGTGPAGKAGWWDAMIGPGKTIDTDRFFVISPNVLGGNGGTTSAAQDNPATGNPYGMEFPVVTIQDMARAHVALLDQLGIDQPFASFGGCFGGFQVMELMAMQPPRTGRAIILSATPRTSAHNTALWSVLRAAIKSDPAWKGGNYYDGSPPEAGVGLLSMIGALFWLSREQLEDRYGTAPLHDTPAFTHNPDFAVEAFLNAVRDSASQGRLDANTLIYLTRAIDYFDIARDHGSLQNAFAHVRSPVLLVSNSSDWRYPTSEMTPITEALPDNVSCEQVELKSTYGHGAFIYDPTDLKPVLERFLA